MPDLTPEQDAASMQLVSEAIRVGNDVQRAGIERLETKATILLGFIATAVPLYAAQDDVHGWLRAVAFVAYAAAVGSGLLASHPYRSRESPPPKEFAAKFIATPQPPASISRWLIASRVASFDQNHATAKRKAGFTWIALYSFVAAASLSVASLVL